LYICIFLSLSTYTTEGIYFQYSGQSLDIQLVSVGKDKDICLC
jgi:hypothetical protein